MIAIAAAAVAGLCTVGVVFGVHAAIGDNDGPAVQLAHRGVDLRPDSERGGAAEQNDGSAAGAPETPAPSSPPPSAPSTPLPTLPAPKATPEPSPGPRPERPSPTPSPTPTPSTPPKNPYLDPADPRFVSEADRAAWSSGQQAVRACMVAAGFEYREWEWWNGGTPKPSGLDEQTDAAWRLALQGDEQTAGCAAEAGDAPSIPPEAVPPGLSPEAAPPTTPPESGVAPESGAPPAGSAPESGVPSPDESAGALGSSTE
ncbi:hypothetical protein ROT00_15575 [Agromyces mediolanus]|uniref:hypothetical protein n=1 Tax=Agromyces mediolanus TaxID=41986 RepID=UPI0038338AC7